MLANFVIELVRKELEMINDHKKFDWVLYFNGSSNRSKEGTDIIFEGAKGVVVEQSLFFNFQMTNN